MELITAFSQPPNATSSKNIANFSLEIFMMILTMIYDALSTVLDKNEGDLGNLIFCGTRDGPRIRILRVLCAV